MFEKQTGKPFLTARCWDANPEDLVAKYVWTKTRGRKIKFPLGAIYILTALVLTSIALVNRLR